MWSAPSDEAYPAQLQRMLGQTWDVVNLGSSGSTLSQDGKDGAGTHIASAAYWCGLGSEPECQYTALYDLESLESPLTSGRQRPQFETLRSQRWDAIVLMLGTNDCKMRERGAGVDKSDSRPNRESAPRPAPSCLLRF